LGKPSLNLIKNILLLRGYKINILLRAYSNAPLLLCLATLGWGGNTIAGRLAAGDISPMVIVFLRWSLVVPLLLLIQRNKIKESLPVIRENLRWIFFMGASGLAAFNILFYQAAHYTTAINLGVIQGVMPAFILIFSLIFYKTKVIKIEIVGLFVSLFGVLVIVSKGNLMYLLTLSVNSGDILILLAVFGYAGYAVALKKRPNLDMMTLFTFFAISAWLTSIPFVLIEGWLGYIEWPHSFGWLIVFYIALAPSFMSQIFFIRAVDLIGPGKAGLYTNLVPIYAAVLGVLILGESFRLYHFISLLLVFLGIYVFSVLGDKYKAQLNSTHLK